MRVALLGLMAIVTVSAIDMTPAEAQNYPFCIKGRDYASGVGDCSFTSYQQCQASASGRIAYCDVNPYYESYAGVETRHRRKRHHHYN
jgi:hypothetical protein